MLDNKSLDAINKLRTIEEELSSLHFVEREDPLRGIIVSLIADTNVLLVGPPGGAKSMLATKIIKRILGGKYFELLLHPYTQLEEVAGPISLESLQKDRYKRNIENTINEADVAFLDEVFKCGPAILNYCLSLMNERIYYNDGKRCSSPLLTLIGASNELPEESDGLAAFLDRFVLKYHVPTLVEKNSWMVMFDKALDYKEPEESSSAFVTIEEIRHLQKVCKTIEVPLGVRKASLEIIKALSKEGVMVSPRVGVQSFNIAKASALLDGRSVVNEDDLLMYRHTFWTDPTEEPTIHRIILKVTSPEGTKLKNYMAEAAELFSNFEALAVNLETKDPEVFKKVTETLQNLRNIKDAMERVKKSLREKDKSTHTANDYLKQVISYMNDVYAAATS